MTLKVVPTEIESNDAAPETTTEAEKPTVDLPSSAAMRLPIGVVESLKSIRHEIALLHSHFVKEHGQIPSYLGGAYQAVDDAEDFLKRVIGGQEIFTPVPKKPELKDEDKCLYQDTVKVPSNLSDIPYMQEWAGTFFFPELRKLVSRTDVEVNIRADQVKKKLQLAIMVTVEGKPAVILPAKYRANAQVDLKALAKSIDAL